MIIVAKNTCGRGDGYVFFDSFDDQLEIKVNWKPAVGNNWANESRAWLKHGLFIDTGGSSQWGISGTN